MLLVALVIERLRAEDRSRRRRSPRRTIPTSCLPARSSRIGTPAALERHNAGVAVAAVGRPARRRAQLRGGARSSRRTSIRPKPGWATPRSRARITDAALQHFDRAVVANPRYAPALAGRGDALLASASADVALKSFEAAAAADPSLQSLESRIDVLTLRVLQDEVAAARKAAEAGSSTRRARRFQRAIAASPQSPFLYRELAAVERQDNDLDAALEHAQKAASAGPDGSAGAGPDGRDSRSPRRTRRGASSLLGARSRSSRTTRSTARVEDLRSRAALAAMPPEYQAIDTAPTVTRAQLAALIGVRLEPLLSSASTARTAVVITDARTSWASPWILSRRPRRRDGGLRQPHLPAAAIVRRADLARAASRVLALIADEKPALGAAVARSAAGAGFRTSRRGI